MVGIPRRELGHLHILRQLHRYFAPPAFSKLIANLQISGIPIFVVPLIAWKFVKKTPFHRASSIDLWSGRLSPEDEVPEPAPTTKIGKFFDYLA